MQEARRTPLTSSAQDPRGRHHPSVPHRDRRPLQLVFGAVATALLVLDQTSKQWAIHALVDRDIPVVGKLLTLHLTFNPGAAFSTGTRYTWVFSTLAIVAVCVVIWLSRRLGSVGWAIGLGCLLGGVAGNLGDRLFRDPGPMRGHVVDFLMLPKWPVFNVADICINIAAGVIILQTLRGIGIDGSRDEEGAPGDEASPPESDKPESGPPESDTEESGTEESDTEESGT